MALHDLAGSRRTAGSLLSISHRQILIPLLLAVDEFDSRAWARIRSSCLIVQLVDALQSFVLTVRGELGGVLVSRAGCEAVWSVIGELTVLGLQVRLLLSRRLVVDGHGLLGLGTGGLRARLALHGRVQVDDSSTAGEDRRLWDLDARAVCRIRLNRVVVLLHQLLRALERLCTRVARMLTQELRRQRLRRVPH